MHKAHDIGIARRLSTYSDAVEFPAGSRILITAGTPGLRPDGYLPASFEAQAEQAWQNILAALERAEMGMEHVVKVTQYLVRPEDLPAHAAIRARFFGEHRPASMLMVVAALPRPEWLIEIEAIAAAPPR